MESLYDHNPTPDELRYLFLEGMSRAGYLASPRDEETEFGHIYALYMIRGRRDKAMEYLERIRDPKKHFSPKPKKPGGAATS